MNDAQNTTTEQTSDQPSMSTLAAGIESGQSEAPASPQPEQVNAPDNVAEFTDFVNKTNQQTQALKDQLGKTTSQIDELVNGQRREAADKAIKSAVGTINENAGGDEKMAELFLEKQYRENPDFKKIWENRAENPEAYTKALNLLTPEWESMTQTVTDPQVAENQRALMESQNSGGQRLQGEDLDTKLNNMSDADFLTHMRRLQD